MRAEELMLLNCDAGEDFWESVGQHGGQGSVNPKGNQSWIFPGITDAEAPILDAKQWQIRKDLMLRQIEIKEEGDGRGWDG